MWRGFEYTLTNYGIAMCKEWKRRGFRDTMQVKFEIIQGLVEPMDPPWWIHSQVIHISHQSNLLRKLPEYYSNYFPKVTPGLPYVWPKAIHEVSAIGPDTFELMGVV
jgi:hypothetical protein